VLVWSWFLTFPWLPPVFGLFLARTDG